ncbi:HAMP domain-containing sensor histidine kinase [Streptomyces sp. NPDC047315]|uniref:sensor histidine kinase n=1 Tax=Streptomyces sp. NPDC047315 TaxID=3155142 RepID=UPI0033E8EF47
MRPLGVGRIVRFFGGLSARTRIALVFGAVFLVLGGALLTVVNLLSSAGTETEAAAIARRVRLVPAPLVSPTQEAFRSGDVYGAPVVGPIPGLRGSQSELTASYWIDADRSTAYQLTDNVSDAASQQMLYWSVAALLVTALCAVAVGWWTAGRVLRPVHAMTARARRLSERTLHERIGDANGPDDELKELGDTLDALLARLEKAFDGQRRFIANASHELRTPLATQRTAIQVGLDPAASADELAATKQVLLESNRRSERLIEGLLMLARGERGLEDCEDVDLGAIAEEEAARYDIRAVRAAADRPRLSLRKGGGGASGPRVRVRGDRLLLAQLVDNLVANAVAYNVPGGTVSVVVSGGVLTVENTGPTVPEEDVPALFEPFRRGEGRDRMGPGAGLGLSIVRSIAEAHGGTVTARPGPSGGLSVTVRLPEARTERGAGRTGRPARPTGRVRGARP